MPTTATREEPQVNDHNDIDPQTGESRRLQQIRERAAAFSATWGTSQDLTTGYASATGCAWDDDR
jgi:hypothetical protein